MEAALRELKRKSEQGEVRRNRKLQKKWVLGPLVVVVSFIYLSARKNYCFSKR